ncbi:ribonuclease domain-containing protein [Actimicrobium antarcticum]|uniref:Ribonuclease n=1 Tax=Actimicrobium antarcticum TaxID=1051899 RepID=A0ABP7TEJ3_9BURK
MSLKVLRQVAVGCVAVILASSVHARQFPAQDSIPVGALPHEAKVTLSLIKQGGPFPYEKDGSVFGNYERQLPGQKRGYYREYTVPTPRARNRGARRIIVGGQPPDRADYFYTADHYVTFKRISAE